MNETRKPLQPEDTFSFSCHAGLSCFTSCCRDVNILLSPYDIIRMKRRLGLSSTEFLARFTKTLVAPKTALPAVQLRMDEESGRRCYFVGSDGCSIYEDRPWSCRMYPLDVDGDGDQYRLIVDRSRCHGLDSRESTNLGQWFRDQGLESYSAESEQFAAVTGDAELTAWRVSHPQGAHIFHLACYDLDRFRELVFREALHEMIGAEDLNLEELRGDDLALLAFSYAWLKALAEGR
jgi:Fe-S-cluster containining protein